MVHGTSVAQGFGHAVRFTILKIQQPRGRYRDGKVYKFERRRERKWGRAVNLFRRSGNVVSAAIRLIRFLLLDFYPTERIL
jgi:hypothetical protein